MPQRNTAKVSRQSDLQPVYDLIDALQPAKVRAAYNRLSYRTRAFIMIGVGVMVLIWTVVLMLQAVTEHVRATTGPFLMDAIKAPYQLETRLIPMLPADQGFLLPISFGEYSASSIPFQATPAPDQKAGAPVTPVTLPASALNVPLANCLLSAVDGAAPTNCTTYTATFSTSVDYMNASGTAVNVAMSFFAGHTDASQVMRKIQQQAATLGSIGNYAIGVTPVDYFYSSQSGIYSFSWANGPWVNTASSASFDDLEKFLKQFPY